MKGNAHKTENGWMVSYLSGIKDLDSISVIPLHPEDSVDNLSDGQEIDFELQTGQNFKYAKLKRVENSISTITFSTYEYKDSHDNKCHIFRAYYFDELLYERDYGYNVQTELDYITNYLSQTKI